MGKKILFCQLGGFGDIIQTTNVLKVFKRRDPDCHITYVTSTPYKQIMAGIRLADDVKYIYCDNRVDAFHGMGRDRMEQYINYNKRNYDEVYFPQVAFHRDLLIEKNKWQVVKTLFGLCGITDYPIEPFDVRPSVDSKLVVNKPTVFVECNSFSGQSFVNNPAIMVRILNKVQSPDHFHFILSGASGSLGQPLLNKSYEFCCDPYLKLLNKLKFISVFIGCHSGLTNLYGCEHCYNPSVPVISLMHEFQKPVSIGPEGYPVIKQMQYALSEDEAVAMINGVLRR